MNILSRDRQAEIIAALTEGCSIRSVERLTDTHRDTIMRLGVRVGQGCAALHDELMRGVNVGRIEIDEIWSYVGKKQARLKPLDSADLGDQYVFIALAGVAKAIISYRVGKRTVATARAFLSDLYSRVANVLGGVEISSDAWTSYPGLIEEEFGLQVRYGIIDKSYAATPAVEAARRYSPAQVVSVARRAVIGAPAHISTSYVERQNLTMRMSQRRFGRLVNAFSKKLENHEAAVALYVAHYNLCRVHEALRVTPAMQLGITDHIWTIGELVDATLAGDSPAPQRGPFTVIQGGRT
jgi:IS1 family transposase